MARLVVTQDLIIEMNELYLKIGTYAGVSRALGGSPSAGTVKKYIIPNYSPQLNLEKKKFTEEPKEIDENHILINNDNWGKFCTLSTEEFEEIKELWKEIAI